MMLQIRELLVHTWWALQAQILQINCTPAPINSFVWPGLGLHTLHRLGDGVGAVVDGCDAGDFQKLNS